jgi:carboxypeptidase D
VDQYPSYLQYAYEHGLLKAGTPESQIVESKQAVCNQQLSNGGKNHVDTTVCEGVLRDLLEVTATGTGEDKMCYNMYDVRLKDKHPSCGMAWPPDLEHVTPYLRQHDVVQALHVNPEKRAGWTECNGAVGGAFSVPNSRPSYELLPGLLAEVPIILFSGEKDLICNHLGTEAIINGLEFNGGKGFEVSPGTWAPRRAWRFEDEPAGFYQEARNLTYILFYNSSHMVPFDYPRRTRDMLDRFMGVDIGSIGGKPTKSLIDGEHGPQTSVGGHPNSTAAEEEQGKKLEAAEWKAYYKSGEVALVVVAIAAAVWAYFIWRGRRRRAGYLGVFDNDPDDGPGGMSTGMGLEGFSSRASRGRGPGGDLEAADFDESELDDLAAENGSAAVQGGAGEQREQREREMGRERYSLGEASDTDSEKTEKQANGHHG